MTGRRLFRLVVAVAALAAALALAGCGGDEGDPELTVSAAASLTGAFERYGEDFEGRRVRFSFGGSDELAAQIRRGARPDVYAAANTKLPDALHREGLIERPVTFATNRLVLAVPRRSDIDSLEDLERPRVKLVVGAPSVPVGSYTQEVLARLGAERSKRITRSVRSQEPDVKGVVAKVAGGAGDAGFVYRSDVEAAGGRLEAIELPSRVDPTVAYGIGVVRGTDQPERARAFVDGLLSGRGAEELRAAGLGPPSRR